MTPKEAIQVWKDIFNNKTTTYYRGGAYPRKLFGRPARLRTFDVLIENGTYIRTIEQNLAKQSVFTTRAKEGHRIAWFIPVCGNWWRVEDEKQGPPGLFGIIPARRVSFYKNKDNRPIYTEVLDETEELLNKLCEGYINNS
jgi:hypothetical protein